MRQRESRSPGPPHGAPGGTLRRVLMGEPSVRAPRISVMRRSLSLLVAVAVLACAPRREATVPFLPSDALTRATRILESFEYNIVEVDREEGLVRGMRTPQRLALWEVTVHVTPAGDGSHYRLESRTTGDPRAYESVDSEHLDRILEVLADWRR